MPFGFGAAAPRFASTPPLCSMGADPERGLSEYSTFVAPSQKCITATAAARPSSSCCNEHDYSRFLLACGTPTFVRRQARVARGTGSAERFASPAVTPLGPGEYHPQLALGLHSRPHSRGLGAAANESRAQSRAASAQPSRAAGGSRPNSPSTQDVWRMTFSAANVDAQCKAGPSAFTLAADSVASRCSFLDQRMTRSQLSMHCSAIEKQLWRTRPCSYLGCEPQIKPSFNKRVNDLASRKRQRPNSLCA